MSNDIKTKHIELELSAVIVSVNGFDVPEVLAIDKDNLPVRLPSGPFDPENDKTLELGLRNWIVEQTPFTPGYVEQLYTFGNQGRVVQRHQDDDPKRIVSVGYLALTHHHEDDVLPAPSKWEKWYEFFPWEDWRTGRPDILDKFILPALEKWISSADCPTEKDHRIERSATCFAMRDHVDWDYEYVLERYELLYEARLIPEVYRDKGEDIPGPEHLVPGKMMRHDHRRILATGIGRLRGKIKYRPVIFELMPDSFTLLQLQKTIEAIGGYRLHKQNFRRLLENNKLVEETGEMSTKTGGRPAALFRFRKDVLLERIAIGVKMSPAA